MAQIIRVTNDNVTVSVSGRPSVTIQATKPTNTVRITNVGVPGSPGQGVPTGGTAGQILKKDSGSDYDVSWQNEAAGTVTDEYVVAMAVSL